MSGAWQPPIVDPHASPARSIGNGEIGFEEVVERVEYISALLQRRFILNYEISGEQSAG